MKKILISALIVLLIILAYFALFKGISMGSFQILSIEQIGYENDKLTGQIAQTELLMNNEYPAKTSQLEKSVSSLLNARDEYLDLANVSTDQELQKANQEEIYTIEFLITQLGRHATAKGVNLKLDYTTGNVNSTQNVTFTVSGDYYLIVDFIRAVEDDSTLGFRVQNFKMIPSGSNLEATFVVTNVKIKQEGVTSSPKTNNQTNTSQNSQNTTEPQNSQNTTEPQNNQNTTEPQNNQTATTSNDQSVDASEDSQVAMPQ